MDDLDGLDFNINIDGANKKPDEKENTNNSFWAQDQDTSNLNSTQAEESKAGFENWGNETS